MKKHTTRQIIESDIELSISTIPARNKTESRINITNKLDIYKQWMNEDWISYEELTDWLEKRYHNMDNIQLILNDLRDIKRFRGIRRIK